jgi:hypothetical protein
MTSKLGRNDPCHCGSGQKYKKCCIGKDEGDCNQFQWLKMRKTEGELVYRLLDYAKSRYGEEVLMYAWDDFTLWPEDAVDPNEEGEFESAFIPWFLFLWIPDHEEFPPKGLKLDELPIAISYLAEHTDQLDEFQKRFIKMFYDRPYSFYIVEAAVAEKTLTVKDIFLGDEFTVIERRASTVLKKGDIIYTRVLTMDGVSIMIGCAPLTIPPIMANQFIDMREKLKKLYKHLDDELLHEYETELREIYYDIKDFLYNRPMPKIQNTDGDPLVPTTLHYKLECETIEAFDALETLAVGHSRDDLLSGARFDKNGVLKEVEFSWLKKGNKKNKSWDNTLMGEIHITGSDLTVNVNSEKRAAKFKKEMEKRLPNKFEFKNAVHTSIEQALKAGPRPPSKQDEENKRLNELPEVQEFLKEKMKDHWENWLDMKIPALKNMTPREAAKTPLGRERLEALLSDFEQRSEKQSQAMLRPDIKQMRQKLGMIDEA